jgi:hypothetical protein
MGRSAGCVPLRILSTWKAARRIISEMRWPIEHQASSLDPFPCGKHAGQALLYREVHDLFSILNGHSVFQHKRCVGPLFDHCNKSYFEVLRPCTSCDCSVTPSARAAPCSSFQTGAFAGLALFHRTAVRERPETTSLRSSRRFVPSSVERSTPHVMLPPG